MIPTKILNKKDYFKVKFLEFISKKYLLILIIFFVGFFFYLIFCLINLIKD